MNAMEQHNSCSNESNAIETKQPGIETMCHRIEHSCNRIDTNGNKMKQFYVTLVCQVHDVSGGGAAVAANK